MENVFLKEIHEQSDAFRCCLEALKSEDCQDIFCKINTLIKEKTIEKIVFTGMGSSYFVSVAAASLLTSNKISAFAINAAELLFYQCPVIDKKALLICISQSGESIEIVELLKKVDKDTAIVGITNVEGSTLSKRSDYVLYSMAGTELMTSTKTFITTYLVAYVLTKVISNINVEWNNVLKLQSEIERLLGYYSDMDKFVEFLDNTDFIQLMARGTDFATASQTALMFMEAAKTSASAMLGAEFRHGPLEMVNTKFVCIIFSHSFSATYMQSVHLINDILKYNGKVIFITDKPMMDSNENLLQVNVCCTDSDLFLIPSIIPAQLLVNSFALNKGLVPGIFTHGAKVTSIE